LINTGIFSRSGRSRCRHSGQSDFLRKLSGF
jgi:hypothetical protein